MASNTIKGLTVEIGGNTTKLGKALESVNKRTRDLSAELGQVNRLLRMDPGNADLLAQKQKLLADAVENTKEKLDKLKQVEAQVQEQFKQGKVSEAQVRELRREIIAAEQKLKGYERAAEETAKEVDNLGKKTKHTAEEVADANGKMADLAAGGLKSVATLAAAAVTALTAATEGTRDYRVEMGKLDTAFTTNGFTSEQAAGAYKELVGVLGETDRSVEAANHLAKLTDNEKDLATWTGGILPGVFATFGDSLPIEGLTEAANETAKVGQVTGSLADALNWAGVNEDAFHESLAACSTEQERRALIMQTLNSLYGEASAGYKETNADVIAANRANDALRASLAGVGSQMDPIITEVKMMGAELLSTLLPGIRFVLDNLPAVAVILGGVTAAMAAFQVAQIAATAATKGMTLAQYAAAAAQGALNAVMAANPIGLIILAITALVAAFMLLWNNLDGFAAFWKGVWDSIKNAASAVVEWFKETPGKIWDAILGAVERVKQWGAKLIAAAKAAATNTVNNVIKPLMELPGKIWSAISATVSRVAQWGADLVAKGKKAATDLVSSVVNGIKSLPGKMANIGKSLVEGLWNGIKNMGSWIKDKLGGFANDVLDGIKSFFGINSPSKETEWVGEMLDKGLAKGVKDNIADPIKAMRTVTGGVLSAAEEANGMTLEQGMRQTAAQNVRASAVVGGDLMGKLDRILAAIERGAVISLDGKRLVGATAGAYDHELGQRRALAARGVL